MVFRPRSRTDPKRPMRSRGLIQNGRRIAALHRSTHEICYLTNTNLLGWRMDLSEIETKLTLDLFSLGRDVLASWLPENRFAVLKFG